MSRWILPPAVEISTEEILADLHYPATAPGSSRQGDDDPAREWWARPLTVRWSDVDANGHMRNTAYSEIATEARLAYFAERGIPLGRLTDLGIAPVLLTEQVVYRREAMLGEELSVSVAFAALSRDASRGTVKQRIRKPDGATAALVAVEGGWLSLESRRIVAPPEELAHVMRTAPRTPEFRLMAELDADCS
jgi:acyl-CoA thioester hydrolase